jgi:ACS family hexuronate transporter-like MFS transporter
MAVFVISAVLNYGDRLLLAAAAPLLRQDFHLSNRDYGFLLSAISIAYALSAPLMGMFMDRVGLNLGISLAVGFWSLAGAATGLARNFIQLLFCRVTLSAFQAAGIPSGGKASSTYLDSKELAIGNAMVQTGLSIGGVCAPIFFAWMTPRYGWPSAFYLSGALGLVWIPVWLWTAARMPKNPVLPGARQFAVKELLGDRRFWFLMLATVFAMTLYTLWSNWTTLYFVEARHMTHEDANRRFAWMPPLAATFGALVGGLLAFRWIRGGLPPLSARLRVCLLSSVFCLLTAAVPLMPSAEWAAGAISFSYFWCSCFTTNLYVAPIDMFGHGRAGLGVASLTFSYGLMQTFVSPLIGGTVDRFGFGVVCIGGAILPLIAVGIMRYGVVTAEA